MQTLSRTYEEKRRHMRMQIDAPAQLITNDGETQQVTCIDLSSHGIQLESHTALRDGELADFVLAPGSGPVTPLHAKIRVCRVREIAPQVFRAGATFESLQ